MNKQPTIIKSRVLSYLMFGLTFLALGTARAQTESTTTLVNSLSKYKESTLQEKIFLHTDRESYLVGESIWFKVYNVNGDSHKLTDISKIAYVEVLDQEYQPILQTKVALKDGTGKGSFLLPATIKSGNYLVRAYTNWMKNFSSDLFFQKPITIVNTFLSLRPKQELVSPAYNVQFFPEGGHLVNGVQSVVAYKAVDAKGESINFKGVLLNHVNDTLAKFSTHKFGMGRFSFTPVAGHQYRAILTGTEGQIVTRALPKAQDTGYVLELKPADGENLQITVRTNPAAPAPGGHTLYLLAHTRKTATIAEVAHPGASGQAVFTVPKIKLGDGITHFTVFNAERQPVCERLYFRKPVQQLDFNAKTESKKYSPRSEVNLDVIFKTAGAGTRSNFSVAVYRKDSLSALEHQSVLSYLWLSSELKGTVEQPDYYFTQTGAAAELAQDNLMLAHGWSKFNWEKVLSEKETAYTYSPEYGGHLIRARVLDAKTKQPVSNIKAFLASPSRYIKLYAAESNPNGQLLFDVMNFYGPQTLVLQTNISKDSAYTFELESPFSMARSSYKLPYFELPKRLEPTLLASSIHMQVQNYHTADVAYRYTLPSFDSSAFYGTPDKSYLLDDYTRFPVMEEVMREYVQPVFVRKRQGKFNFFVVNQPQKALFDQEPMILLDGVPVFDTDRIMAFDPRKVQRLDVVSRKYFHGSNTFNGLVSYVTYTGNLAGFEVDPKALLQEYEGMQLEREFYSPAYTSEEQRNSRVPDLRNLLYWNPDVNVTGQRGSKLKFYTSDQAGTYQVIVHGISNDGRAGTSTYIFKVE